MIWNRLASQICKQKHKKNQVTHAMWHATHDKWLITCDMGHMEGREHSLKTSGLYLTQFGSEGILKIWRKRISELVYEWMTKVFVEQPQLHLVW